MKFSKEAVVSILFQTDPFFSSLAGRVSSEQNAWFQEQIGLSESQIPDDVPIVECARALQEKLGYSEEHLQNDILGNETEFPIGFWINADGYVSPGFYKQVHTSYLLRDVEEIPQGDINSLIPLFRTQISEALRDIYQQYL